MCFFDMSRKKQVPRLCHSLKRSVYSIKTTLNNYQNWQVVYTSSRVKCDHDRSKADFCVLCWHKHYANRKMPKFGLRATSIIWPYMARQITKLKNYEIEFNYCPNRTHSTCNRMNHNRMTVAWSISTDFRFNPNTGTSEQITFCQKSCLITKTARPTG